jgi:hypothetical protein
MQKNLDEDLFSMNMFLVDQKMPRNNLDLSLFIYQIEKHDFMRVLDLY